MTIVVMTSFIKNGVSKIKRCTSYDKYCEVLPEKKTLPRTTLRIAFKDVDITEIHSIQG